MIYDLLLSKGQSIKIDEEDLQKIRTNISSNLIQVKQGIFNPSFMVMIVPTKEPDVIIEKSAKEIEGRAVYEEKEVKVLSDLMGGEVKRLNG